jgi:predicted amidohydrolase
MLDLLKQAKSRGVRHVAFPELALTTFFPRDHHPDPASLDRYFEIDLPGPQTRPLFEQAARAGIGFTLGYAEQAQDGRRFNRTLLVNPSGDIVGNYRKVHLPGTDRFDSQRRWQQLERRYFSPGDLGFRVWRTDGMNIGLCLCNDRRWPESFRILGLQDVELIAIGFCTPVINTINPESESAELRQFQSDLTLQAGAYQNATFVVSSAKAGVEEGCAHQAGSAIVAPTGEIVARAETDGDELVSATIDLDDCTFYKRGLFDFATYRRPEVYGSICRLVEAVPR